MLPVCGKRKNIYLNVYKKIGGGYTIKCSKMLNIAGKNWSERRLIFITYTLILFEIFIWVHFSPEKKRKEKDALLCLAQKSRTYKTSRVRWIQTPALSLTCDLEVLPNSLVVTISWGCCED